MSLELTTNDNAGYVAVDDEMTIYTALLHKEKLLPWIREFRHLVLDMSNVPELDGAGVQLLLTLNAEAERQHTRLELANLSETTSRVLSLLRLTDRFSLSQSANEEPRNG
ncbi:STAS domain-containing protein [Marinobacterium sp. YM272]|uniref:STAS domain-containing protein n=1 Tax=Marinobacterium sp. YM272 TaxID=3421654 RepID=UPI003D7FAAA7